MKKKFSAIILALVFTLSSVAVIHANSNAIQHYNYYHHDFLIVDDLFEDPEFILYLEAQKIEHFGEVFVTNIGNTLDLIDNIFASLPASRSGDSIFPDYFGGKYINDDGILVVQFTGNRIQATALSDDSETFGNLADEDVIIEHVTFSYNELNSILDYLAIPFTCNLPRPDDCVKNNFAAFYDDIRNNRIVVELHDYNEYEAQRFRNYIIDSPAIHITSFGGFYFLNDSLT